MRTTPLYMHASTTHAPKFDPPAERLANAEKRIPLTPAQHELWLANQLRGEALPICTESTSLELAGSLDVEALRRTLSELVARHEMLRTTFSPAGDAQVISETSAVTLSIHERSRWVAPRPAQDGGEGSLARAWSTAVNQESVRPFDLTSDPLFRPVLTRGDSQHHILTLIVHPIICDQSSLSILLREWGQLYTAAVARQPAVLKPAPSFHRYVGRQPIAGHDAAFARADRYWRECFADGVPNLDWPADRPRPARRSYAGGFVSRTLAPEFGVAVRQFCSQENCTAFTTLLAVFAAVLHRLTGENDLVIGVPTAAQVLDVEPGLVGPFANLLPVRSRITEDEPFTAHLAAVQRSVAAALEHGRYPFPSSLRQVNLPRDASGVPLMPALFHITDLPGALDFGGLVATFLRSPKRCGHFDVDFNVTFTGASITLECDYSTELFDGATVVRWLRHFETLLHAIIAQPECAVTRLPLLTVEEHEQIVVQWNQTQKPYDRERVIAELFEAQVARTPSAIALVAGEDHITYQELDARAGRLAQRLRACNVGPDVLVGVFTERTPGLVVAILGILKAGGAYVPLDPKYPAERLEYIVHDTRMRCLVAEQSLTLRLPAGEFDVILVDHEGLDRIRRPDPESISVRIPHTADHLAYVMYTSGSTGQPKGVAIIQRCVVALVAWARDWYQAAELDGVLFSTSASFDISVFELFCPLCLGGKIVLAESMLQLPALPARSEVRHLSGVPFAIAEIVRANAVPPSVTTITLAGEPLPRPLVDELYGLSHVRRVFELYGPTETTVYSSGIERGPNTPPTLGRPLPNECIYILDPHLQPVPIGVRGEIYIGGDKLARGYLNRPDLTAERFMASPFPGGGRLYRTGDVGRWSADGMIESLGRTDHQVKVWGFRIELGEVESVLARHPDLAEAAVIARPALTGSNRLTAYAVPCVGGMIDPRVLRAWLQRQLPAHMLPTSIVIMNRLPRTANGKVDRRCLSQAASDPGAGVDAPSHDATERIIREIWCQVLGLERVGLHDNFFALGGNLVRANQLMLRVKESIGTTPSWPQFFAGPTVAALALVSDRALPEEAPVRAVAAKDGAPGAFRPSQSTPATARFSS